MPGPANPQAWNRYSYVLGNPLRYTDPTGHGQCQTQEDCDDMGTTPMGTGGSGGGSTGNNGGNGGGGNPHDNDDFDPNPNCVGCEVHEEDCGIGCALEIVLDSWNPDYITLNFAVPISVVPVDIQVTRDYYGNWYAGAGLWVGTPGASLFGGTILGGLDRPQPQEIEDFITTHSIFAGGGLIWGVGGNWGHPFDGNLDWSDFAAEGGLTTPGFTAGWTYTQKIGK